MSIEPGQNTEPSIGQLVGAATRDVSSLLQKEIQLAKSELKVSVAHGTTGIAFFAVAGFLALLALIMFSVAAAYLIHWNGKGLDLHWAFLCVTGFYLVIAIVLSLLGLRKVKKVRAPERALAQAEATLNRFTA